jgi:cytochrome oxidase Cu insertion factor (SCO1/SenC/PrrC family)
MRPAAVALCATLLAIPGSHATEDRPRPERLRGVSAADLAYTYGPGGFAPEYALPPPGSYALPVVDTVDDHGVVDADGRATTLFTLKRDRLAVVSFVYTTCVEGAGCPLSMAVLQRLDRALAAEPALAREATLITVSFDPERDTAARMAVVRKFHAPKTDWHFVTTPSTADLQPILLDFNQPVAKLRFPDGEWSGLFRHVLKVFLLDRANRVRNVYSAGFLDPALVLNDLRTVLRPPADGIGSNAHDSLADVVAREKPDQGRRR